MGKPLNQTQKDYMKLIEEIRNSSRYDRTFLMYYLIFAESYYRIAQWLNMSRQAATKTCQRAILRVVDRHIESSNKSNK